MSILHDLTQRNIRFQLKSNYDFVLRRLKCYDNGYSRANTPGYPPTFASRFCSVKKHQHLIALANEDGKVAIQNVNLKDKSILAEGTRAHHNAIFDLAWMDGEFKLVSVSGDHTAVLWDVTNCELKELDKFESHTRSVKTVAFKPQDKAVFATGGRDGMIMIWDTRSKQGLCQYKPDNVIANSHTPGLSSGSKCKKNKCPSSRANSVTGLIFQNENTLISCGAGDGMIKIWDLRKHYSAYKRDPIPRTVLQYSGNTSKNGFTNLLLDPTHVRLYASCMDNTIYCYNVASYDKEPVSTFVGHETGSFYVRTCLSPDGNYLVSGSSDEKAYIWNVNNGNKPVATLVGHFLEVTCVAWCPEGDIKIVTCSDDAHVRYWEVGSEYDEYNDLEIRGWAEEYSHPVLSMKHKVESIVDTLSSSPPISKVIASLETTPRSQKRSFLYQHQTPSTLNSHTKLYSCQNCAESDATVTPCMKCMNIRKKHSSMRQNVASYSGGCQPLKRRLEDLMEEPDLYSVSQAHSVLSPISECNGSSAKRFHLDNKGARRLFDLPGEGELYIPSVGGNSNVTVHIKDHIPYTGTNLSASPTMNLPNYVVDGTSPHHSCVRKSLQKENVDWLTKLKKEKVNGERMSCTVHHTPKRRSRSGSSSDGTLLKFFRVSGKVAAEQTVYSTLDLPVKSDV